MYRVPDKSNYILINYTLDIQYRSNVSWQSLEARHSKLDSQSSIQENFKDRESSFEPRLSTYSWAVLYSNVQYCNNFLWFNSLFLSVQVFFYLNMVISNNFKLKLTWGTNCVTQVAKTAIFAILKNIKREKLQSSHIHHTWVENVCFTECDH